MAYISEYLRYYWGVAKRYMLYKNGVTLLREEDRKLLIDPKCPNNFYEFPYNIMVPEIVTIGENDFIKYRAKFSSLHDLYEYLKSHPSINRKVFSKLSSITGSTEFAGASYEESVEALEEPPRSEYREFLDLSERLDEDALDYIQEFVTYKSPGGGSIDIPAYASGSPFCYTSGKSVYTPKFIRLNVMLSYNCHTTKEQVLNRALIIASLVSAFERSGYVVEVNTFELAEEDNEVIEIDVNIKNSDETFNKAALYKTLCYVEFLRRLLFRVLETLDVKKDWQHGYGSPCSETFARKVKRMDENDIFIDEPCDMGIEGEDIGADFRRALEHLNIADKIDVEQATKEFDKDVLRLKKTIV